MATRAKQQYYGDGNNIVKNSRTFELSQEILDKIDSAGGEGAISTIKVNGVVQPITNKTVNIGVPVVEDNLNSYSTANALSANQGRLLYDEIQKFQTIGHFLSLWDSTTGKPVTDPTTLPYIYNTGDYFIVSKVGTTNYRPDGTEYTGAASQVAESETVKVDDFYFFNGTNWFHLSNEGAGIAIDSALSTTSTNPVENRVITEAINQKASLDNLQSLQDQIDEKADAGDIPTVNDATLTIQKNGTDQGTFSANQAVDTTINLTVNKIDVGLSNVDNTSDADKPISTATQTALDDLSDRIDGLETGDITDIKDDITDLQDNKADKTDLGDATLTVQKNGTDVGTFTANSKTDTTINLELTKSDVGLGNVDNTADVDKPISTAVQTALDAKADKSDTYTKTETDAKIDEKLGDEVSDATITITQGGTTKGTFTLNQANAATIALDAGSEDGMQYPDFAFVTKTGNDITLDISSKVANPSADFTINAPSEVKDGITYVLRVENGATPPAMTLGTNITNPYNVDLTLSPSKTDTFAFLAVGGKLEMQPTEADVPENVYTKEEVNQMVAGKMDTPTGGTVGQVLTKTASGSEWADAGTGDGDVKYEDFEFAAMSGTTIENLSSTKSISADTTLTAGTSLKEGMQYLVTVTNTDTAKHAVTFGSDTVDVEAGESKNLVFLATSANTLELQKSNSGGGGDLSNYYTKTETNTLLDDKADKSELQLIYDAIVAADGSGDYTTLSAAIDDNKKRIFVKDGTYNETNSSNAWGGYLTIHGQSKEGTTIVYGSGISPTWNGAFIVATQTQGQLSSSSVELKDITFEFEFNGISRQHFIQSSSGKLRAINCDFYYSDSDVAKSHIFDSFEMRYFPTSVDENNIQSGFFGCRFFSSAENTYIMGDGNGGTDDIYANNCYLGTNSTTGMIGFKDGWFENCMIKAKKVESGSVSLVDSTLRLNSNGIVKNLDGTLNSVIVDSLDNSVLYLPNSLGENSTVTIGAMSNSYIRATATNNLSEIDFGTSFFSAITGISNSTIRCKSPIIISTYDSNFCGSEIVCSELRISGNNISVTGNSIESDAYNFAGGKNKVIGNTLQGLNVSAAPVSISGNYGIYLGNSFPSTPTDTGTGNIKANNLT